jgi:hypothetical protein
MAKHSPLTRERLYDLPKKHRDEKDIIGFNYPEELFKKSLSNQILKNPTTAGILKKIQDAWVEGIEAIKRIKVYYDFSVDKDYRKFN